VTSKLVLRVYTVLIAALLLLIWQFISGRWVNQFFISSPTAIWDALVNLEQHGNLWGNMGVTMRETAWGFLVGSTIGALMGLCLGRLERTGKVLDPFVVGSFAMPRLAMAPLFILWFGVGEEMKDVLSAFTVYFPVYIATYSGAKAVEPEFIDIARVLGASKLAVFGKVVLQSAMVWLFAGLKQAVTFALLGAVVGELIASSAGLGWMLNQQSGQFNTAAVMALLLVMAVLGYVLYEIFRIAETKVLRWRVAGREEDVTQVVREQDVAEVTR
jgi:NitT/TauT family transport system permease protein